MKHLLSLALLLAACTAAPPPAVTPTPQLCGQGWVLSAAAVCIQQSPELLLVQTDDNQQAALHGPGITITARGTLLLHHTAGQLTVGVLEGTGIISALEVVRILPPGAQSSLPMDPDGAPAGPPGIALPLLDGFYTTAEPELLPRPVTLPQPIAAPPGYVPPLSPPETADEALLAAPAPADNCPPPDGWTRSHTVQRGETLSRIALAYSVSTAELQAGNCITNPNQLAVGQVLNVPDVPPTATQSPATFTPSAVAYRADRYALPPGECTTIRWDVYNVQGVTFDGQPAAEQGSSPVCPTETTEYLLLVDYYDGSQSSHSVTIIVNP